MIAFMIDPEARTIEAIDFDGDETSIPKLIDCEITEFEQWPRGWSRALRIYSSVNAVRNAGMYGFSVPLYDMNAGEFVDSTADPDSLKRHYRIYKPSDDAQGLHPSRIEVLRDTRWR
jgi:hypothetical protein